MHFGTRQIYRHIYIRKCGSTLYVGLQHAVPPTNTKVKPLLLPTQMGIPYRNTHKHRTSYFKSTRIFLGPAKRGKTISATRQKTEILHIRECCSSLRVGLQHAVPPTNTKLKQLLLPTQAGMPYTNTYKHRTSYFKSTLTFLGPPTH